MTAFTADETFTMFRVRVLLSLRGALTKSQIQKAVPKAEREHLDAAISRALELELVVFDAESRRYSAGSVEALMASPEVSQAANVRLARLYPADRARASEVFRAAQRAQRRAARQFNSKKGKLP